MTLLDAFVADIRRQLDRISGGVLQLVRGMELLCETIPGLYDELYRRGDVHRLQDAARAAYTIRADLGLGEPSEEHLSDIIRAWPRVLTDHIEIETWYAGRRDWDGDPSAAMAIYDLLVTMQRAFLPLCSDDLVAVIEQTAAANGRSGAWQLLRERCREVRASDRPSALLTVVYLLTEGDRCQQQ